jgi:hypothetical protein
MVLLWFVLLVGIFVGMCLNAMLSMNKFDEIYKDEPDA